MLGSKPPHNTDQPVRDPCNFAAAATEMMWAVSLASAQTAVASTARSIELWLQMLWAVPSAWPLFASPPGHGQSNSATPGASEAAASANQEHPTGVTSGEAPTFASYRSSSGHAAAQVSRQH